MVIRQLLIDAQPAQMISLYFDSRSNADKAPEKDDKGRLVFMDDYKQKIAVSAPEKIVSDITIDLAEQARAQGEMTIANAHAELKFSKRLDNDQIAKSHINMKRSAEMMRNAARVQPPPGIQT